MKYLAIDYGTRRVGLAVSDDTALLASPYATLEHDGGKASARRLLADMLGAVRTLHIDAVVVGLPRATEESDGGVSEMEAAVRAFATRLHSALARENLTLGIYFQDERFSTAQVLRGLRDAGVSQKSARGAGGDRSLDARSAAVILQSFLDARRPVSPPQENDFA